MTIEEIKEAVWKSFKAQSEREMVLWVGPKLHQDINRMFREELEKQGIKLKDEG